MSLFLLFLQTIITSKLLHFLLSGTFLRFSFFVSLLCLLILTNGQREGENNACVLGIFSYMLFTTVVLRFGSYY